MLVYPCGLDVSSRSLSFLAARLRERRRRIKSRWRRLLVGCQALLVLAHLRNRTTYAQLAAGFGIGTSTVYRYISEAVDLLAALAPTLEEAVKAASTKAYVLLDGTLLRIDRIAADRPFYSGKHKKHGMNVQVITDPFGRLLWASPALPGAVHNVRAAREHGIINALGQARIPCWADWATKVPVARSEFHSAAGKKAFHRSAGREPIPNQDPSPRRTSHGHPQELAAPSQTPLLDHPHHRPRPGRPHPASRQLNRRLKRPQ
ncbi:hypothetical protein GCM10010365_46330 [Streptomyces poonensis]|uniref:Transposase n=1 Tax=Streptomyces poonensis TaxID=68255 RepID=A0A918PS90_9ACTN|nr:hypothetical protein GCM10010365_46330 [Streptomyces poonensis]